MRKHTNMVCNCLPDFNPIPKPKHVRKRPTSLPALAGMFLPHPVNGAQSNRHDTAFRRGVTGARGVNAAKPDREGPEARPQRRPARASRSGAGRENEKSARQVLPPEKRMATSLHRRRTLAAICPAASGGRV